MVFVGKMNCFDIYKGVDKKMGLLFDICKDGNILETLNSMKWKDILKIIHMKSIMRMIAILLKKEKMILGIIMS